MENLIDKYGKKKVYGVAGAIAVLIVSVVVAICVVVSNPNKLVLNEKSLVVELGEEVSLKPSTYLDSKVDKAIVNDTILKSDLLTNEEKYTLDQEKQTVVSKEKKYLEVGKYEATLNYKKKEELIFTIEVKDTKAPVFKDILKEIVVEQDAEDVDFTKYFKADDISEFKIMVDSEKVDLAKQGDYEIKVTATDKYKNEDIKTVNVKVVALEEAEKENAITKTLDETVYQSKAMKDKLAEAQRVEEEKAQAEANKQTGNANSNNGGGSPNSGGNSTGGGSSNGGGTPAIAEPYYRTDISNSYASQINAYRQQNGLSAVPTTGEAQAEANMRAMQLVSSYGHNSSAGFGENIGRGDAGYNFFIAWQNSSGHNANMLRGVRQNGVQEYCGMAVAVVEYNGYWYAVTSFQTTPW